MYAAWVSNLLMRWGNFSYKQQKKNICKNPVFCIYGPQSTNDVFFGNDSMHQLCIEPKLWANVFHGIAVEVIQLQSTVLKYPVTYWISNLPSRCVLRNYLLLLVWFIRSTAVCLYVLIWTKIQPAADKYKFCMALLRILRTVLTPKIMSFPSIYRSLFYLHAFVCV